jgi:hypothetical protein
MFSFGTGSDNQNNLAPRHSVVADHMDLGLTSSEFPNATGVIRLAQFNRTVQGMVGTS